MLIEVNKNEQTGKYEVEANITSSGSAELEANKEVSIDVSNYTEPVEITPSSGKNGMKKATVTLTNISSGSGEEKFRYFDGRNTGYSANPRGFWVIGKNQTSGNAYCLVLGISQDGEPNMRLCIQTIQSVTDDTLSIDKYGRETLSEVTADTVAQAIANLN